MKVTRSYEHKGKQIVQLLPIDSLWVGWGGGSGLALSAVINVLLPVCFTIEMATWFVLSVLIFMLLVIAFVIALSLRALVVFYIM